MADGSTGSGTLIDRDEKTGVVLTCSHLFDPSGASGPTGDSSADIVVSFPNGTRYGARLIDRDRANDLAAVLIRRPEMEPISFDDQWQVSSSQGASLTACGYGASGHFRGVSGPISGIVQATGATGPAAKIVGAVRPGDSGGGVLNRAGRLVGVVWGQRDGETYLTCGRPLREFVDRVLRGRRRSSEGAQHDLQPRDREQNGTEDFSGDWPAWRESVDTRLAELEEMDRDSTDRLDSLRESIHTRVEERIGALLPAVVDGVGQWHPGLPGGLSYGKLLAGALGLSGPVAVAVMLAGGLAGRRLKSRESRVKRREPDRSKPIAVDSPPPRQLAVPETHYVPVEKDDFARAHQWASEQVARKYPGATEVLSTLDGLIKQQLAASKT